MIEREFRVAGCVLTSWVIPKWSRRQALVDGLSKAGFNKFAPSKRTPQQSLKDALLDTHRGRRFLVVPLKKRDGFEIRRVEPVNDTENEVHRLFAVTITASNQMTFHPQPPENYQSILDSFNCHLGLVRTAEVSSSLVNIIQHLGGTSFPGGRGIYFLPPDRLPRWQAVAEAVESASFVKPNAVYIIRHALDPDAIRAVRDGLVNEVRRELALIDEDISSGKLKERAILARQKEAADLEKKIMEYEKLLGESLESLREAVDQTAGAIGRATLLAHAAAHHEACDVA